MVRDFSIRSEGPADFAGCRAVNEAAFGGVTESNLVDDLRRDGDLVVSLVAEDDNGTVGHIGLSRMVAPPSALALAPLAVVPDRQGRGIGSALVRAALKQARALDFAIVFVLGDPAFYGRFGFAVDTAAPFTSPYAGPHFMAAWLGETTMPPQAVTYAAAFSEVE